MFGMILAFLGFMAGVCLFVSGLVFDASGVMFSVGVIGMFAFPVVAFVLMFVVAVTWASIHDRRYQRKLEISGWAAYKRELEYWKLAGHEDFDDLARIDPLINLRMSSWVYGGNPPKLVEDHEQKELPRRRLPSDDPELDALEDALDNATPGPRHSIRLASARRFRRHATRLARMKTEREAEGKRFIAQVAVPATRAIGVNSAGWHASMPITDEETAAVRAEVTPYFEAMGLHVTKLWLGWRGMSVGEGGNYESLDVVVRVV